MPSSEDELDDDGIYDQLKSIKAFTIETLYSLYPDVSQSLDEPLQSYTNLDDKLYQNLVDFEQIRHKILKIKDQIEICQKKSVEHADKVWTVTEKSLRKVGMCRQGKIVETSFKYNHATKNIKQLDLFGLNSSQILQMIEEDYVQYSFESKVKCQKVSMRLSKAYCNTSEPEHITSLKSCIVTLVEFMKFLGYSKSEFSLQCRRWLRSLIRKFLEIPTTEKCRFVISQLSKGPAGTADWAADLVECKPFSQVVDKVHEFESTPVYILHCCSILGELFSSFKEKVRPPPPSEKDRPDRRSQEPSTYDDTRDQSWSLIDPRFNCTEDINLSASSRNILCEADMIKFCIRIPITQIFRAHVKECLESKNLLFQNSMSYQDVMLKLLIIGTRIIETYKIGLETFNSIQYGNLIEYLSSQTRITVIILSEQWTEFKRRLKGVDDALMMRLQVEYDNFILRSIRIILELRESGIWRHLSRLEPQDLAPKVDEINSCTPVEGFRPALARLLQVTGLSPVALSSSPLMELEGNKASFQGSSNSLTYEFSVEWFKEVSEPMLWHIVWQFYHNAFVSACDYHSDTYWLEKFREKSAVYLFINKMKDSPPGECNYLLNSMTSVVLSRARPESKLITFIATEIFNLSFRYESMKHKINKTGIKSLKRCAEKFPSLISLFISYMNDQTLDDTIVELMKVCSLKGWLCNENELTMISRWLKEQPLNSAKNQIARLIISKIILNSPDPSSESLVTITPTDSSCSSPRRSVANSCYRADNKSCFIDLKLRRQIALLLYEASIRHLPEPNEFGPRSLGTSVEVALEKLFCDRNTAPPDETLELAVDVNYTQFYVWVWRLLFTFRLHILNQPETDWNDLKSRSGTSRSIKNTVLLNDSFHPVPSMQDTECFFLAEGLKNQNPMASFICLMMTDISWQSDTLNTCLGYLNNMASTGHLTPSMKAIKYLSICHLNDLQRIMAKDQQCIDYFLTIVNSNFDATRLASLIVSQMQNLKQYRQLQLSEFYVTILLSVAEMVVRKQSMFWFSANEHSLEKIAIVLDYIVKFNFTTQKSEIVRKFHDCSHSLQNSSAQSSSWIGSILPANSPSQNRKAVPLTVLHLLTQKFKSYFWLRWVTIESDTINLEKAWENILIYLGRNDGSNVDQALKANLDYNASSLKSLLPIFSWSKLIFDLFESDLNHPLNPLVWYNFFLNYFANPMNGASVGHRLVTLEVRTILLSKLNTLINYHHFKNKSSLTNLYAAYREWLKNDALHDAFVEFDSLRSKPGDPYLVDLLQEVTGSTAGFSCVRYIDLQSIEMQNRNLSQIWLSATRINGNEKVKEMMFVDSDLDESLQILAHDEDHARDATSLDTRYKATTESNVGNRSLVGTKEELQTVLHEEIHNWKQNSLDEVLAEIRKTLELVFDECRTFNSKLTELKEIRSEMVRLFDRLYSVEKTDHEVSVRCSDDKDCTGPAKIKFVYEKATFDDRTSAGLHDRQRQSNDLIDDLMRMPSSETVHALIIIENTISQMVRDSEKARSTIESLLKSISEPKAYNLLNGNYYVGEQLLKTLLEIMSNSDEIDTYNNSLIDVCFKHPGSVKMLSPHFSPSTCSQECFLQLYQKISSNQSKLVPTSMFVLLSKFDLNRWLVNNKGNKEMHQTVIKTTCEALSRLGKLPDKDFNLTLDIYRRHIQIELALPERRKPEMIALLMDQFLAIMDRQLLWPDLWFEFLMILGLERHSVSQTDRPGEKKLDLSSSFQTQNSLQDDDLPVQKLSLGGQTIDESTLNELVELISRLADCQTLLDYHSATDLIKRLSQFVKTKHESINVTLIEYFCDYLEQFSVVILTITFIWLRIMGELYPDNHDMIWQQFVDLWHDWIYLSRNCQNVSKLSYGLLANQYVAAVKYMIAKIPDNTQAILKCVLSTLTEYSAETEEVVYLELTILQRSIKNLPWSQLYLSRSDFDNLALLSNQENCKMSDLISHIVLQVNMKESLIRIQESRPEDMPYVVEQLATIIVLQSPRLKGFHLNGRYFAMIPLESVPRIVALILPRMEFSNLEHNQKNKLLVGLLRFMCIKLDSSIETNDLDQPKPLSDCFERSLIYAKFVSDYLADLIKNHPEVIKDHAAYIQAIVENSIHDLKILVPPEVPIANKTAIYLNLLDCCNESNGLSEEASLMIVDFLLKSQLYKDRPILVMELFQSLGQIMSNGRILISAVEHLIVQYLAMNGHYEKVWKSFVLTALPGEAYLGACVKCQAPLSMLILFESIFHNIDEGDNNVRENNQEILSSDHQRLATRRSDCWPLFFYWTSQLTLDTSIEGRSNETRLVSVWIRLLDMFESHLDEFVHSSGPNSTNIMAESESEQLSRPGQEAATLKLADPNQDRKYLTDSIRHLLSTYDEHNSTNFWSYLRLTTPSSSKFSLIALAVASFLTDRILLSVTGRNHQENESSRSADSSLVVDQVSSSAADSSRSQSDSPVRKTRYNNTNEAVTTPAHLVAFADELSKLRRLCLAKLESVKRSKYYVDYMPFVETLIESINRSDKVQYSEGVQLIASFVKSIYLPATSSGGDSHSDSSSPDDSVVCINKILSYFAKW